MESARAESFAEGRLQPAEMTAEERAISELVERCARHPARLAPADLEPLAGRIGLSGALEIVAVIATFHYINRLADMVGIELWMPRPARRRRWLRRRGLRIQLALVRLAVDVSNRRVAIDAAAELDRIQRLRGVPLPAGYLQMLAAPSLAATVRAMLSWLPCLNLGGHLEGISRAVSEALPAGPAESADDARSETEPLTALARVATRRSADVTPELVDAVRRHHGWTDGQLTDAFYAIGVHNSLERLDRLLAEPLAGQAEPAAEPVGRREDATLTPQRPASPRSLATRPQTTRRLG